MRCGGRGEDGGRYDGDPGDGGRGGHRGRQPSSTSTSAGILFNRRIASRHVIRTWCTVTRAYLNPSGPVSANATVGFRMDYPWTLTPHQVLGHFQVDPTTGLSRSQVAKHTEIYGANGTHSFVSISQTLTITVYDPTELPDDPPTPLWQLVLEQFKDQLVLILLASALVSFVLALVETQESGSLLGAFVEPLVILLILVVNATVGVIQETNAEKAIDVCTNSFLSASLVFTSITPGSQGILPRRSKSL